MAITSLGRFSARRRKILAFIHLNAGASYDQIARVCGTKSHNVRSEIRELVRQGIISPKLIFNHTMVGFLKTSLYFEIRPLSASERKKFLDYFCTHPRVVWACELIGEFNFGISLMARDASDLDEVLNQILRAFPGYYLKRDMIIISAWSYFGKKYLVAPSRIENPIHMDAKAATQKLSDIDRKILKLLSLDCFCPQKQIAEKLKIPLSTVNHHMSSLQQRKIISGFAYWISYSRIRITAFRLLVACGGINSELQRKFFLFAEQHPNIVSLIFSSGAWDLELGIDLEDPYQIHTIIAELRNFSQSETFKVIPLMRFDDIRWSTIAPGMFDVP